MSLTDIKQNNINFILYTVSECMIVKEYEIVTIDDESRIHMTHDIVTMKVQV